MMMMMTIDKLLKLTLCWWSVRCEYNNGSFFVNQVSTIITIIIIIGKIIELNRRHTYKDMLMHSDRKKGKFFDCFLFLESKHLTVLIENIHLLDSIETIKKRCKISEHIQRSKVNFSILIIFNSKMLSFFY